MDMKFSLIIGNPPYNNDIYIDFVTDAHKLSSEFVCMITPAKWQAKGGEKNEQFRKAIVPYMSKILFYKDSHDIFSIQEWGGISCYLVDKSQKGNKVQIKTICNSNDNFNSNFEEHDELNPVLYSRKILQIIGKVGTLGEGFKQSLYVKNTDSGESCIADTLGFKRQTFVHEQDRGEHKANSDYVEIMQGDQVCGYKNKKDLYTQLNIDKWKCICSIMPGSVSQFDQNGQVLGMIKISIIGPNQVPKGSFPVLKYFDSKKECYSFVSYCNTRLISFLFYLGVCGITLTKEFFRFIPDPVKYDHIFTDEELYEKYGLTQDEINIIESVIKKR